MNNRKSLEGQQSFLLLYGSVILPIFMGISFIPSAVKYMADILWIGLVFCSVLRGRIRVKRDVVPHATIVVLLLIYVMLVYLCRFQSLFYFLWGFRNLFRFYIAFFAYLSTVNEDQTEDWFSFLEKIFWINFAFTIYQFVFMNISQDYLGGVFGTLGGTNGFTMALLCVVVTRSLLQYFEKKGNTIRCFMTCAAALIVAAMAEIKAFFVIIVVILLYSSCLTKFSVRKLFMILCGFVGVIVGVRMLIKWFGFEGFFSIQGIIELATSTSYATSSSGDVNRLSAIASLNRLVMDSATDRIFGLGLGNCDTSAFSMFNSVFYSQHKSLHYTWFTAPMVYLETGYIGLALYLTFFVACFLGALKKYLKGDGNKIYCEMTMILSIIYCIVAFYNASLRYEAGYMLYFTLALPYMRKSSEFSG